MRCPYGKTNPLFAILLDKMSTEHLICMIVRPLMKQVKIELA